jgi:hypothetical protein
MSTTCIYKAVAVRVPATIAQQPADQFLLIELVGSNNCYEHSGRRARSWQITASGPEEVIIADAIYCAGGFVGGMVVFGSFGSSGHIDPEEYIAKVRRLLKRADTFTDQESGVIGTSSNIRLLPRNASDKLGDVLPKIFELVAQEAAQQRRYTGADLLRVTGDT